MANKNQNKQKEDITSKEFIDWAVAYRKQLKGSISISLFDAKMQATFKKGIISKAEYQQYLSI